MDNSEYHELKVSKEEIEFQLEQAKNECTEKNQQIEELKKIQNMTIIRSTGDKT